MHFPSLYFLLVSSTMGRRLPINVLLDVLLMLELGKGNKTIARECNCSKNTVRKLRVNMEMTGRPYLPSTAVQGRPAAMLPYQEEAGVKVSEGVQS